MDEPLFPLILLCIHSSPLLLDYSAEFPWVHPPPPPLVPTSVMRINTCTHTPQRSRADVHRVETEGYCWPSQAINRLLEFIIVSSYDGEEPGGLREGGRQTEQHLYRTTPSLLAKPSSILLLRLRWRCTFNIFLLLKQKNNKNNF